MQASDFVELEKIEFGACGDLYRAAPDDMRATLDIEARLIGRTCCLSCRDIEPAVIFRRAVGIGVGQAASQAELDEVLAYMSALGQRYAIPVAPQSEPPTLASWLEERGFTPGYAWMKFRRLCADAPQAECDLEIRVVGAESGPEFGRVVTEGFGLPPALAPWIAVLPARPRWVCVMAFTDGTAVAAGAAYIDGDYAWLGFGATLGSHRRQGAQNALLARRLGEANARGARVAVTETGERLPDRSSQSYRNILRSGFEEMYLRQHYMSPSID
jgi:hypothetical protein